MINVNLDVQAFQGRTVKDIESRFIFGRGGGAYLQFHFTDKTSALITMLASSETQEQGAVSLDIRDKENKMELTLEDLMTPCTKCDGSGKLDSPEISKNQGGIGRQVIWASPVDCEVCRGHGVILSETGKGLITFIERARAKGLLRF